MRKLYGAMVALTLLIAVGLILIARTQPAPLRFLRGHVPLANSTYLAYVYKADQAAVLREARDEFHQRGYIVTEKASDGAALKADDGHGIIDVFVNTQWTCRADGVCFVDPMPGTVAVIFWGEKPSVTFLDRVHSFLHL
jgi:hypothetical protein